MKTFTIVLTILFAFATQSYAKPERTLSSKASLEMSKGIVQNMRG